MRQAEQAAGGGPNGRSQDSGTQTAALDRLDRLRSQIESLSRGAPNGRNGQQPGQNGQAGQANPQGRNGQPGQQGQQGQQRGQGGQQGQGQQGQQRGQGGQQGQGQQGQGQQGQGQQRGQNGQGGQQGGQNGQGRGGTQQAANGGRFGGEQLGNRGARVDGPVGDGGAFGPLRGGGGGVANYNVDTGGQTYSSTRNPNAPQIGANPADTQRVIDQGLGELSQLHQAAKGDPAAEKQIQDLEQELQKLDPSRFKGNPAMVDELHTKVLNDVDKLELQLRRDPSQPQAGQVRTASPPNVPAGYEDAVAEYYRRLGKGQ